VRARERDAFGEECLVSPCLVRRLGDRPEVGQVFRISGLRVEFVGKCLEAARACSISASVCFM
jgi:hypothetical protein